MRNGKHEFGRCTGCGIDMMRSDGGGQRVPKGFRIVWRPRAAKGAGAEVAGQAAFAQEVNLRGVTVLGERTHGGQRFALVVLNQKDQRSYRALADEVGTRGQIAEQVESRSSMPEAALGRLLHKKQPLERSVKLADLLLPGRAEARN